MKDLFDNGFDDRTAAKMKVALERACSRLAPEDNVRKWRRMVAGSIAACARAGDTSPSKLSAAANRAVDALPIPSKRAER